MKNIKDKIEQYLGGELSPNEEKEFEKAIKHEANLSDHAVISKEYIKEILIHLQLDRWKQEAEEKQANTRKLWIRIGTFMLAACLIGVVMLVGVVNSSDYDSSSFIARSTKSGRNTAQSIEKARVALRGNKNVVKTIEFLEGVNNNSTDQGVLASYYLAIYYKEQQNYSRAKELLIDLKLNATPNQMSQADDILSQIIKIEEGYSPWVAKLISIDWW